MVFDGEGKVTRIIEKPETPPSNYAVTGQSFLDGSGVERAKACNSGCPEEIAFNAGWIDHDQLAAHARKFGKSDYGKYLARLL